MTCPHCEFTATTERSNHTALGYRRFRCHARKRGFNERTGILFNWMCQNSRHDSEAGDADHSGGVYAAAISIGKYRNFKSGFNPEATQFVVHQTSHTSVTLREVVGAMWRHL